MSDNDSTEVVELLSTEYMQRLIGSMAYDIISRTRDQSPLLLGIPSGGVPLAQRLAAKMKEYSKKEVPVGALDVTLYRDDLRSKPHRALLPTTIPVGGVDGKLVILVDDVFYSGRTIRAALEALHDIGRPEEVQLAVFVNRGHRQLPIRPDYVGKDIPTARSEDITVFFTEIDGCDAVTVSSVQDFSSPDAAATGSEY